MDTPSEQLLKEIRADLVRRGSSMKRFCEEHGFVRQHVGQVVAGKRSGPKAIALLSAFLARVRQTR